MLCDDAPVVLVDDDEASRRLIERYLQNLRLCNPIITAVDGQRAIEALAGCEAVPALILLDVCLPYASGLEVLEWVRADARLREVPVVMLTGRSELEDIDRANDLGICSYLVKPVGFVALADVVRNLEVPWKLLAPQHVGKA